MPEIKQDLRSSTMIVAANNSLHRNDANYVCDGVADDVEINAALAAVAAGGANIGRVILLDGTYICAGDITVPDYCTLEGQGSATRLYFDGDAIVNAITIGGDFCSVKNLAVDLEDGAGIIGARPNIIYSTGFDHTLLENLELIGDESVADDGSDLRQCGILFVLGAYSKIVNCHVSDNDRHGIHLNDCYNCIVEGNHSGSNGYWGILLLNSCDWNNIVGNNCNVNNHGGIEIAASNYNTISGNDCDSNILDGIWLNGAMENTVTGNTCHENVAHGINLDDSEDNVISGNSCCENEAGDTGFNPGIRLDGNSVNNQITGNVCNLNHGRGMNIVGANNNITGNQCSTNDREGIYASGPGCQINGNHIYDNGQDAPGTYNGIGLGGAATNSQVNDNYCDSPNDSQEDGINLGAGAHYIQVIGNYCANGMGSGIQIGNNDYCLIKDNYCYNNDDYGISIGAASDHSTVENNKLEANGGAINDAGTDTILPEVVIDAPNTDANIGEFPVQQTLVDADTELRMKLHCPADFQELVRAHIVVIPLAGGNLRWSVNTDWGKICAGEAYNTTSDAIGPATLDGLTASELECLDITAALTGLAASDWIGVRFTRLGTHIDDTLTTLYVVGMRMQYV